MTNTLNHIRKQTSNLYNNEAETLHGHTKEFPSPLGLLHSGPVEASVRTSRTDPHRAHYSNQVVR